LQDRGAVVPNGAVLPRIPTPGVARIAPPRLESTVPVGDGRRLGIAEFGDPDGRLVLWFHGTPGARRQIPPVGRRAALHLGIRLVCVERPGVGASSRRGYYRIGDIAADAATIADVLGHERFATVGLSGGGPYALACGALLPERVAAVAVLGGVCPSRGDEASSSGVVSLARTFRVALHQMQGPLGLMMQGAVLILPVAHLAYQAYARVSPPGDRAVLLDPEIEAMFVDDLGHALRAGFGAVAHDAALFGRHWGFALADIPVPVRWWHGDADSIVSLADAQAACERIADVELHVRPGESHLGGFAAADEVLETISALL
jgi:pimeloyl-ACP methyl ester carboxylesterase